MNWPLGDTSEEEVAHWREKFRFDGGSTTKRAER
jgi:hypothetical protein